MKRCTSEERRLAVSAVMAGETAVAVAKRLGVTKQAVCLWVKIHKEGKR